MTDIYIVGIGMTALGKFPDKSVKELTNEAVSTALTDAGDTITDFNATDDLFELSALMTAIGYTGSDAVTDGYVGISQSGANTLVQIDTDGGGDSFTTLATLENVTATDIDMGTWSV